MMLLWKTDEICEDGVPPEEIMKFHALLNSKHVDKPHTFQDALVYAEGIRQEAFGRNETHVKIEPDGKGRVKVEFIFAVIDTDGNKSDEEIKASVHAQMEDIFKRVMGEDF